MRNISHAGKNPRARTACQWNTWRYAISFPLLIAALCVAAMLSSPLATRAANTIRIGAIKAALDQYESNTSRTTITSGGVPTTKTAAFSATSSNSFGSLAELSSPPQHASNSATVDGTGYNVLGAITRGSGPTDTAASAFTVGFTVSDPLFYTFSGTFSSSSSVATPGSFSVTLLDVDTGVTLFSYQDNSIPANFSTNLASGISPSALSGQLLPNTNYQLTISSEFDAVGGAPADSTTTGNSNVTMFITDVPEPASLVLVVAGAALLSARRRRLR